MKYGYVFAGVLVILGVYHGVFDDIEQRMLNTFSKAKVGDTYHLSDFTKGSLYDVVGIDYIDFRHPTDIEHGMENIVINYSNGKQKIIYSRLDRDGETSKNQVFLEANAQKIAFGYRCPLNAQIQLVNIQTDSQFYWIKPINCRALTE